MKAFARFLCVLSLTAFFVACGGGSGGGGSGGGGPTGTTGPSARDSTMAYDAESDRVILFGGRSGPIGFQGDTWAYDLDTNAWTNMNLATSPAGRAGHAIAYDAQSDRVILFGGFSGTRDNPIHYDDTWVYDFNSNAWTDMSATPSPPTRHAHRMVYDAQSDRVILFGGIKDAFDFNNPIFYNETWAYDFDTNAWTQLSPSSKPLGGACFVLAYDAESSRIILFGGERGPVQYEDTWAYDFNTNAWTDMNPAQRPAVQDYPEMAYDAGSDRVILFGGAGGAETWAYYFNTNTWMNMNPVEHPSGRWLHAMAYDEGSDRVVLFGGETDSSISDETWAYDFNTNTWTHLQ